MSYRKTLSMGIVLTAVSCAAWADGPFGLEIGAPISSVPSCKPVDTTGGYMCTTVPKPHSAFKTYLVIASPATGICKVAGLGRDITDSGHGISIRGEADKIAAQIAATYGDSSKKMDFLTSGSIWNEPHEWLAALSREQRVYIYYWTEKDGYVPKNNVASITVRASASRSDTGSVVVAFEGANFAACREANSEKDKDAF